MAPPHHTKLPFELINVHKVYGATDVIVFLKNAEHNFVEGLFYRAKHTGRTEFIWRGLRYDLVHNRDASFTVSLSEEQDIATEQFG